MVSVVIVNHNYGRYIGEAIESVLNQTYRDFEIIIVDGASTDNSREVIMSYVYQYPNVITAVFKPTSGQAAGFNVGFKLSKGEIIALLDADDYFLENKLERIVELHKEYVFIGHARKISRTDGSLMDVIALQDDYETRPFLLQKYGYICTYQLITSCISLKRELAAKIFPMPEEGYITFADCYVKVMAQYISNIKYVREVLSYYRLHNVQETKKLFDEKTFYEFVNNLYEKIFRDINRILQKNKEQMIPTLTDENLKEAFAIANPNIHIHENASYVIYGTGVSAMKVYGLVERLDGKIVYVIDSNPDKWGQTWNNVEILSPEQGCNKELGYDKIIIGSYYYYKEIKEKLESLGLKEKDDFLLINSMPND